MFLKADVFSALEKQREKELKKSKEDEYEDKNKVAVMYSERKKRLQSAGNILYNPIYVYLLSFYYMFLS